jgi:hypothetical protein
LVRLLIAMIRRANFASSYSRTTKRMVSFQSVFGEELDLAFRRNKKPN